MQKKHSSYFSVLSIYNVFILVIPLKNLAGWLAETSSVMETPTQVALKELRNRHRDTEEKGMGQRGGLSIPS